jgi:Leucine-rich repeat (LRR) protein
MQLYQHSSASQIDLHDNADLLVFQNIPVIEFQGLNNLYDDNNGINWDWTRFPDSGIPWYFPQDINESSYPNPCTEQWQGIECSCYLELGRNVDHPRGKNSGFASVEIGYYSYYYDYYSASTTNDSYNPSSGGDNSSSSTIEVACSVSKIQLIQHNLQGELSSSITVFSNLSHLMLDINKLYGNLTEILLSLPKLESFTVANNLFTGTFPSSITSLSNLQLLNLNYNQFYGTLPSSLQPIEQINIIANQFSGTLPSTLFRSPCPMTVFNIVNNHFIGTIPKEITNCEDLLIAWYGQNFFDTQFPWFFLTSFPSLLYISGLDSGYFPMNFFDEWISILQHLEDENDIDALARIPTDLFFFDFGSNHLSGEFTNDHMEMISQYYPNIGQFSIDNNAFHGSLPSNLNLLLDVTTYYFETNFFTGTIPACFLTMTMMTDIILTQNYLHGTIPQELFTNLPDLHGLYIRENHFSGTIPAKINEAASMAYFTVVSNHITGTIPSTLFASSTLQTILLTGNQLTGPLTFPSDFVSNEILQSLDISVNLLSGIIPSELFLKMNRLIGLFLIDNCFDSSPHVVKTLLSTICLSEKLSSVSLDGMSTASDQCVSASGDSSFVVTEKITLPDCLFNSSQFISLSLSGMNLQGTLPSLNASAKTLTSLILSHNQLTGTIPVSYQHHSWKLLDLSYNKISGSLLPPTSFGSTSTLATVLLEVNRLSGDIPQIYHSTIRNLSVLNGNFFTCSYRQTELPHHDAFRRIYSCGTNSLNVLLFAWTGFFALSLVFYHWKKLLSFLIVGKEKHIPVALVTMIGAEIYRYWKKVLVFSSQQLENTYKEFFTQSPFLFYILVSFEVIRQSLITYGSYIGVILMILYGILGIFYGSHEFSYAYTISSSFLTGISPSVILFVFWVVSLVIVDRMIYRIIPFHRKINIFAMKSNTQHQQQSLASNRRSTASSIVPSFDTPNEEDALESDPKGNKRKVNWKNLPFLRIVVLLTVVGLSFFVTIILINIGFLYTQTHFVIYYQVLSQCAMSGMKILFSRVIIPFVLSWIFSCFLELELFLKEDEGKDQEDIEKATKSKMSVKERFILTPYQETKMKKEWCYSYQFILEILFGISINIVAPCIATAIYDVNCFYNLTFEKPPIVEVSYFITTFRDYFTLNSTAIQLPYFSEKSSSYQPLFTYSYQCSSILLTNYVFVFVFMIVSDTFVKPCVKYCVGLYKEYRMKVINSNKIAPVNENGSLVRDNNGKTTQDAAVNENEDKNDDSDKDDDDHDDEARAAASIDVKQSESEKLDENTLKRKRNEDFRSLMLPLTENSILTNFMNYFSILMTFGLMFPPLGLFIVFYLASLMGLYIQSIVKFFVNIRNESAKIVDEENGVRREGALLSEDKEKLKNFLKAVIKLSEKRLSSCLSLMITVIIYVLIPFTLFFFHCFLFDILGDSIGWEIAILISGLTFGCCLACHFGFFLPSISSLSSVASSSFLAVWWSKKEFSQRQPKNIAVKASLPVVDDRYPSVLPVVKEEDAHIDVVAFNEVDVDSHSDDIELAEVQKKDNAIRSSSIVPSLSTVVPYRTKNSEFRRTALSNDSPSINLLMQTMEFEKLLEELDLHDKYYDSSSDILTILIELILTI